MRPEVLKFLQGSESWLGPSYWHFAGLSHERGSGWGRTMGVIWASFKRYGSARFKMVRNIFVAAPMEYALDRRSQRALLRTERLAPRPLPSAGRSPL